MVGRKIIFKAEQLVDDASSIAVGLAGGVVQCDTSECPSPAAYVELSWDGPGPYWIVFAYCWSCHKKFEAERVIERASR